MLSKIREALPSLRRLARDEETHGRLADLETALASYPNDAPRLGVGVQTTALQVSTTLLSNELRSMHVSIVQFLTHLISFCDPSPASYQALGAAFQGPTFPNGTADTSLYTSLCSLLAKALDIKAGIGALSLSPILAFLLDIIDNNPNSVITLNMRMETELQLQELLEYLAAQDYGQSLVKGIAEDCMDMIISPGCALDVLPLVLKTTGRTIHLFWLCFLTGISLPESSVTSFLKQALLNLIDEFQKGSFDAKGLYCSKGDGAEKVAPITPSFTGASFHHLLLEVEERFGPEAIKYAVLPLCFDMLLDIADLLSDYAGYCSLFDVLVQKDSVAQQGEAFPMAQLQLLATHATYRFLHRFSPQSGQDLVPTVISTLYLSLATLKAAPTDLAMDALVPLTGLLGENGGYDHARYRYYLLQAVACTKDVAGGHGCSDILKYLLPVLALESTKCLTSGLTRFASLVDVGTHMQMLALHLFLLLREGTARTAERPSIIFESVNGYLCTLLSGDDEDLRELVMDLLSTLPRAFLVVDATSVWSLFYTSVVRLPSTDLRPLRETLDDLGRPVEAHQELLSLAEVLHLPRPQWAYLLHTVYVGVLSHLQASLPSGFVQGILRAGMLAQAEDAFKEVLTTVLRSSTSCHNVILATLEEYMRGFHKLVEVTAITTYDSSTRVLIAEKTVGCLLRGLGGALCGGDFDLPLSAYDTTVFNLITQLCVSAAKCDTDACVAVIMSTIPLIQAQIERLAKCTTDDLDPAALTLTSFDSLQQQFKIYAELRSFLHRLLEVPPFDDTVTDVAVALIPIIQALNPTSDVGRFLVLAVLDLVLTVVFSQGLERSPTQLFKDQVKGLAEIFITVTPFTLGGDALTNIRFLVFHRLFDYIDSLLQLGLDYIEVYSSVVDSFLCVAGKEENSVERRTSALICSYTSLLRLLRLCSAASPALREAALGLQCSIVANLPLCPENILRFVEQILSISLITAMYSSDESQHLGLAKQFYTVVLGLHARLIAARNAYALPMLHFLVRLIRQQTPDVRRQILEPIFEILSTTTVIDVYLEPNPEPCIYPDIFRDSEVSCSDLHTCTTSISLMAHLLSPSIQQIIRQNVGVNPLGNSESVSLMDVLLELEAWIYSIKDASAPPSTGQLVDTLLTLPKRRVSLITSVCATTMALTQLRMTESLLIVPRLFDTILAACEALPPSRPETDMIELKRAIAYFFDSSCISNDLLKLAVRLHGFATGDGTASSTDRELVAALQSAFGRAFEGAFLHDALATHEGVSLLSLLLTVFLHSPSPDGIFPVIFNRLLAVTTPANLQLTLLLAIADHFEVFREYIDKKQILGLLSSLLPAGTGMGEARSYSDVSSYLLRKVDLTPLLSVEDSPDPIDPIDCYSYGVDETPYDMNQHYASDFLLGAVLRIIRLFIQSPDKTESILVESLITLLVESFERVIDELSGYRAIPPSRRVSRSLSRYCVFLFRLSLPTVYWESVLPTLSVARESYLQRREIPGAIGRPHLLMLQAPVLRFVEACSTWDVATRICIEFLRALNEELITR
ncbi:hypothetical protein GMRT_12665 [Giardia muris]|uniref:Uncharacterized protein n=1 Tax=Giardia muris TaxID=5742 RepID=A0A4Z1T482_GIAMU|nr:hypothetical protein GMRT_12665 [Giardia muris]|eukprot:TNJ27857.1 hypothetical protein GMRT_12665 [Giardia muris]